MINWHLPPSELTLPVRTVHVWHADLKGLEAACLRRLEQHLSAHERARSTRLRFIQDRDRFVATRGLLREILALYLCVPARRLSFGYNAHGKPFLAEQGEALRFNVSHSLDTVLVAVAHECEVGVDVERVHGAVAVEEISEMVLSAPEKLTLGSLGNAAKRAAFLRLWTRKEAYIKADGRGMSLPLKHIDVSVPADRVAVLDESGGRWRMCTSWSLQSLAVGLDYAAALAVEDQNRQLLHLQWPG